MAIFDFLGRNSSSGGVFGALVRLVLRSLQFIMAITAIGLYATDLRAADKADAYTDSKCKSSQGEHSAVPLAWNARTVSDRPTIREFSPRGQIPDILSSGKIYWSYAHHVRQPTRQ